MNNVINAEFQLENFTIPQFSFLEPPNTHNNLSVSFSPSGVYDKENGLFKIVLLFETFGSDDSGDKKQILTVILDVNFRFVHKPNFNDLPDFFYTNSIAIIFPYLRAFVSNITLQANAKLLILPLMNLSELASDLKKNTQEFEI